jgi:serine/threonine-protein kinase
MKRCPKCGKTYPDEANFCPTDAGRLVAMTTDAVAAGGGAPGLVGGRFELGPVIGGGHTGTVHRAVDRDPAGGGAAVAVKLVAPEVLAIPQVAQRIERELKQLERVSHRGVARVIASGKHEDRVFVATELIEGARPLGELVAASGAVDAQRASDLVLAIGEALIEAAKVGVVHRDLAPKNILVTADSLRLINFAVPTPGAAGSRAAGIPEFVAPEVVEGKPVDQRSNIYSLAAIYYVLLTGRPPHIGDAQQVLQAHLAGTVEPPSRHAPVAADVDALIVRALERNAAKRYLTLRQFLDEVERVAHGPEGGAGTTAPFGRAGQGKAKELAQTLMGFGGNPSHVQGEIKTKQMDVSIPPEAVRDAAAIDAAVRAASAQQPMPPVAAPPPQPAASPEWARPAQQAGVVEQYAPQAAMAHAPTALDTPPAPGASLPAAPKVAAGPAVGQASGQAAGKKKGDAAEKKASKGKFRETMWFKKGELDAAAAEEAAATGDANAVGKADLLPIEERYADDGSINQSDADKYSLRTGATSMMPAMRGGATGQQGSVSERELVSEMKGGRNLVIAVIVVAAILVAGVIAAFVV